MAHSYARTRVTAILNGRQELPKVLGNLAKVFDGAEAVLLLTKSGRSEVTSALKDILSVDDAWIERNVSYDRFNEVDYSKVDASKRVFCIRMPNSLYHSISTGYNDALKFVRTTGLARFVHFFADDCRIVSENYRPEDYEWFMDTFSEPFVMDSKMNSGNYAFKKYSPRFVFMSKTYLRQPISFAHYEAKDHFIVDLERFTLSFDEKVKRLYVPELVFRLHRDGVIRHTSFYPDPVLERWVERDLSMPFSPDMAAVAKEYSLDERYLRDTLKVSLTVENAVDPLISELATVIREKLTPANEKAAETADTSEVKDGNAEEKA